MTSPQPSVVRNGACPGRTPKYPSEPGATTSSASVETSWRVGVASSKRMESTQPSPRRARRLRLLGPVSARTSFHVTHLPGLFHGLVDAAHHVEGLLRQVIVLALDDLLEPADRVAQLDVPSLLAGERLRHGEGLRE